MDSVDNDCETNETNGTQDTNITTSNTDEKEQIGKEQINEELQPEPSTEGVGKTLRDGMDDNNKKAYDVLKTGDTTAFLKQVFTREDGTERSYAEMRYLYG